MTRIRWIPRAGLALALLGLGALGWAIKAAPSELTGTYAASTEFVTAGSRETSARPGAMLELRLTIAETGGALTGLLDAQVKHSLLRFAFPVTGSRLQGHVDLAVQVNLCLERPMVRLSGALGGDDALQFAVTSQTITCNFSALYLERPKALRLIRQISP